MQFLCCRCYWWPCWKGLVHWYHKGLSDIEATTLLAAMEEVVDHTQDFVGQTALKPNRKDQKREDQLEEAGRECLTCHAFVLRLLVLVRFESSLLSWTTPKYPSVLNGHENIGKRISLWWKSNIWIIPKLPFDPPCLQEHLNHLSHEVLHQQARAMSSGAGWDVIFGNTCGSGLVSRSWYDMVISYKQPDTDYAHPLHMILCGAGWHKSTTRMQHHCLRSLLGLDLHSTMSPCQGRNRSLASRCGKL